MKKIIIASFCFFITLTASAQWENNSTPSDREFQRIIQANPKTLGFFFQKSLIPRCQKYLKLPSNQCANALSSMTNKIDFDVKFIMNTEHFPWKMEHFIFLAFKKELMSTLDQEATLLYLEALKAQVDEILPNRPDYFNLWSFTLSFFKNDVDRSLQMIAILFQDISYAKMHLAFIASMNKRHSNIFQMNLDLLDHIIQQIITVQEYMPKSFQKYFYPKEIKAELNSGFYHFYVMGYLAKGLQKTYSTKVAKNVPILLSITYEFVSNFNSVKYLVEDPKTYTQKDHTHSHKDIYAAYLGVNYFLGTKKVSLSSTRMSQQFDLSVSQGIKQLLE